MKKILLISNIFPPSIGGPATFISRMAMKLTQEGWSVRVLCSEERKTEQKTYHKGYKVVRVNMENRYKYEVLMRLQMFIQLMRPGQIFVNGLEGYFYHPNLLLNRKYNLKIVGDSVWETARNRGVTDLDIDQFQISESQQRMWAKEIYSRNRIVKNAAKVFVPSNYLKNMVTSWGVSEGKIKVITNGVESEMRIAHPPTRRLSEKLNLVFIGRLTNWKGVETILIAIQSMANVTLTIIGDGPLFPSISNLIRQLCLSEKVDLKGRCSREQVKSILDKSDVLFLGSLYEGLSHTLIESMARGVPCIASDRGGNIETIKHEVDGILIPPMNPAVLKFWIERLRDREEFRLQLAENAYRKSKSFAMENTVMEYLKEMQN